jgi:RNA polymerase sigma factor (sigma-70 family)
MCLRTEYAQKTFHKPERRRRAFAEPGAHDEAALGSPPYNAYWEQQGWLHADRQSHINAILEDGYRHYGPMLTAVLLRHGLNAHDAEDRRQAVFFTWARRLNDGRGLPEPPKLRAWLCTLAHNEAMNHFRSLRRRQAEREFAARRRAREEPLPETDRKELAAKVRRVLRTHATPRMRLVFSLVHREGWSCPQIARELGISLGTVHQNLKWAMDILRNTLQEESTR